MRKNCLVLFATVLLALSYAGTPVFSAAMAQTVSPTAASGTTTAIEYHQDDRTLTVHLNGMPLDQVMEMLSQQTHIRFLPPDSAKTFDSRPVTATFERMPIERAIKQLLGPSNTAMIYGTAQTTGASANPTLLEVRVLDLGVAPIVATNDEPASSPGFRPPPQGLQALREERRKIREERMKAFIGGKGVRRIFGAQQSQSPQDQSSNQSAGGENGSNRGDGGQSSGNASKAHGNNSNKP
jgi:hypothetical protein